MTRTTSQPSFRIATPGRGIAALSVTDGTVGELGASGNLTSSFGEDGGRKFFGKRR